MKKIILTAVIGLSLGFGASTAFADGEHAKCFITPASQIAFIDTFTAPSDCAKACTEADGCIAWTFQPHSFDKDMPGQCKLIDKIFSEEESAKVFCGKM